MPNILQSAEWLELLKPKPRVKKVKEATASSDSVGLLANTTKLTKRAVSQRENDRK